jgi:hypothetical protein
MALRYNMSAFYLHGWSKQSQSVSVLMEKRLVNLAEMDLFI